MTRNRQLMKDILVSAIILCVSFGMSLLFQYVFDVQEHIPTVFVFAVFLISLLTNGYACGILASFFGMIAVNYAFTFPYFALNFSIPVNLVSAIVMIVVSVLTSALTTKLKQHEAIKAESEMEHMRANLLRAISHDLRTPLTTIYGSSTTLLENDSALTEEQKAKILEGIKEDSEWLVRIVENLLSVTRLDSENVKIVKTSTVLDELIDSVILKFRKRYPHQEVLLSIPEDIVMIPMNAILMEQVLINILENAVQHAEGMTQLSLRVYRRGDQAIFEIEDDGCGIDREYMGRVFGGRYDAKGRAADSRKKNAGVGLSVCATIVRAHGGNITAENAAGGGAVFRFSLDTEDIDHDNE